MVVLVVVLVVLVVALVVVVVASHYYDKESVVLLAVKQALIGAFPCGLLAAFCKSALCHRPWPTGGGAHTVAGVVKVGPASGEAIPGTRSCRVVPCVASAGGRSALHTC